MTEQTLSFSVVGGDARQAHLAELLAADGHSVRAYALEKHTFSDTVTKAYDIEELTRRVDCVILPLPLLGEGDQLNTPLAINNYAAEELFSLLPTGQTVVAGKVGHEMFERAGRNGLRLYDYLEREEFSVSNAIPSAEGAIQLAMQELPTTLHGLSVLVLGYGRIGKLLAKYLDAFGAKVTVTARKYSDLAWITANGYHALNTNAISGCLSTFDLIFNTIPFEILTAERLRELKPECLCIDLASKPGGIDFSAAKKLGVRAIWELSIPGKVAPVTAGLIMKQTIYNIMEEWRCRA
ncbi:MAG: dipicolinate synthase subunit DpsA [Oscillospiraceae bacterium]|nr:dipicolinate synthase subunit DpsA [Oscillospiraceae bacterium]